MYHSKVLTSNQVAEWPIRAEASHVFSRTASAAPLCSTIPAQLSSPLRPIPSHWWSSVRSGPFHPIYGVQSAPAHSIPLVELSVITSALLGGRALDICRLTDGAIVTASSIKRPSFVHHKSGPLFHSFKPAIARSLDQAAAELGAARKSDKACSDGSKDVRHFKPRLMD